jgi:lysophospholipase L1-like esterase
MSAMLLMGGAGQYWKRMKRLFGANLLQYLPLWDASGTVATDISGNGRNGAYNSPITLASGISPAGKPCPLLATRSINVTSAALSAAFNGAEGAVGGFAQVTAGAWSDGLGHYLLRLQIDTGNRLFVYWGPTANSLVANYIAGATTESFSYPINYSGWFHWLLSWSKSNERARLYINGVPVVETANLGVWSGGAFSATLSRLGGSDVSSQVFAGLLSDFVVLGREPTRAEVGALAIRSVGISIIGDSISATTAGAIRWPYSICDTFAGGKAATINHSVAGQSIAGHMATQAAACANDQASVIVMALGRNDNNGGDMSALQGVVETTIDTLRASNPAARLFYMNVLPAWTDVGGGTPVALDNIRGAIAAACLAKGVSCWDTVTSPWIAAADTTDGTHPNQAGQDKIAAQVLARL